MHTKPAPKIHPALLGLTPFSFEWHRVVRTFPPAPARTIAFIQALDWAASGLYVYRDADRERSNHYARLNRLSNRLYRRAANRGTCALTPEQAEAHAGK
jgi:hypothetical protein